MLEAEKEELDTMGLQLKRILAKAVGQPGALPGFAKSLLVTTQADRGAISR